MPRLSNAAVITTNAILVLIGLATLCFSVYLFIAGPSECQRFIQNPLIVTATLLFFISSLGLIAALYDNYIIITLYLFFLFLSILLTLIFSIFIFLVTNASAGKAFSDKGIGNVKTGDLQNWIGDHFLQGKNWEGIKRCMADSSVCKFRPRDVDFDAKHLTHVKVCVHIFQLAWEFLTETNIRTSDPNLFLILSGYINYNPNRSKIRPSNPKYLKYC